MKASPPRSPKLLTRNLRRGNLLRVPAATPGHGAIAQLVSVAAHLVFCFFGRAIAQLVSVQVWGTWGPRFKSGLPDQKNKQ